MTGETFRVEVISAGFTVGNRAQILVNGQAVEIPGGPARGLNVAVISQSDPTQVVAAHFDTHASGLQADQFAQWIEDIPAGRIVAIGVLDEAALNLTDRAKRACEMLGSCLVRNLPYRGSWAMVGQRGSAPGAAREQMSGSAEVSATADVLIQDAVAGGIRVIALSAPDQGLIRVQEAAVPVTSDPLGGRGLNTVVLDEENCEVLQTAAFDTSGSSSAADQFATLIEGLPTGRMVAVAARGDCATNLTERARAACELLGSTLIRRVGAGNSWSIVGFKDALPGSVAEAWSPASPASSTYWSTPSIPNAVAGFSLAVGSAGFTVGNRASVVMSGIDVCTIAGGLPACGRGLNVVVFDETSGTPLQAGTYDTYASAVAADTFAALIEGLPAGRIVAVAAMDEATRQLTERARRACEMIGSGLIRNLGVRGSWALIGRKGSAPGSVPEAVGNVSPVGVETWFALDAARQTRLFNVLTVESAGFSVGNFASISATINFRVIQFSPGYFRGLNVAVIDQATGEVLQAQTFDTYASSGAADEFAALIEALPAGRVVAIAVKDEATRNLTERARAACESLGSGMIRQLATRGSWAFVGKKGVAPDEVAEAVSSTSPASCSYWLFPDDRYPGSGFNLAAQSAGTGTGNTAGLFARNARVDIPGGYGRGLNVAVLDERNGTVLAAHSYDTSASDAAADAFAGLIEELPAGRVVIVAVLGDAAGHLTERARRACGTIGSGLVGNLGVNGSWTLMGVKATPPGSALEALDNDGPTALSTWLPFPPAAAEGVAVFPAIVLFFAILAVVSLSYWADAATVQPPPPAPPPPGPRRYNQQTALVAHNAFASSGYGWRGIDTQQNKTISEQLELGARGLSLDVFVYTPKDRPKDLYLCHGSCEWTEIRHGVELLTLTKALTEVVNFLQQPGNSDQIVTIFIESPAGWNPDAESNAMFLHSFAASGATDLIFWPDSTDANPPAGARTWNVNTQYGLFRWPTIDEMVKANKRLVMFVDRDTGSPGTLRHVVPFVWRYARESVFSDQSGRYWPWDNDCGERDQSKNRQPNRSLFLWNHFPSVSLIASLGFSYAYINSYNRLLERAKKCSASMTLTPNFLEIDYVDLSDGMLLTDNMNKDVWTQTNPRDALNALPALPDKPEL